MQAIYRLVADDQGGRVGNLQIKTPAPSPRGRQETQRGSVLRGPALCRGITGMLRYGSSAAFQVEMLDHTMSAELKHFLGQPIGGYLAVAFLDFDADGLTVKVFGGSEGGAAAHEGVKNGFAAE